MEAANKPWARLIWLDGNKPPIDIIESPALLGSDDSCQVKIEGIDQFCMSLERLDDFSGKLTAFNDHIGVNNISISPQVNHQVFNGDTIYLDKRLLGYGSSHLSLYFLIMHDHLKRSAPPETSFKKSLAPRIKANSQETEEMESDREKANETKAICEELNCGICLELIHNCVTLTSCLHNFCGGCISDWLKKKDCPLCKAPITSAKKNAQLNNIIQTIIKREPSKQRPTADLAQLDERDLFKHKNEVLVKPRARHSQESNEDISLEVSDDDVYLDFGDEEEDDSYLQCPECSYRREEDGFLCSPDQLHLECRSCNRSYPNRETTHAQRCMMCGNTYCSLYLQHCDGLIQLRYLKDHHVEGQLSDNIFRGNKPELDVILCDKRL